MKKLKRCDCDDWIYIIRINTGNSFNYCPFCGKELIDDGVDRVITLKFDS